MMADNFAKYWQEDTYKIIVVELCNLCTPQMTDDKDDEENSNWISRDKSAVQSLMTRLLYPLKIGSEKKASPDKGNG